MFLAAHIMGKFPSGNAGPTRALCGAGDGKILPLAGIGRESHPRGRNRYPVKRRGGAARPMAEDYHRLTDFLLACQANEVQLSFADIERILGWPLPQTARTAAWWGNTHSTRQGQAWLAAGWRANTRGIRARMVTFTRQH
jgi:hypothetical protein